MADKKQDKTPAKQKTAQKTPALKKQTGGQEPLLACLSWLTGYFGEAHSATALAEFLPEFDAEGMTAEMFCRAASKADMQAESVSRKIEKTDPALFPVVVLLKDGDACVVQGQSRDKKTFYTVFPAAESGIETLETPAEDLKKRQSGTVILVKPSSLTEKLLMRDGEEDDFSGHWFWQVVWSNKPVYMRALLAAFFINLFVLAAPIFIMNVYDRVLPNSAIETGWVLAFGVLSVFVFDFLFKNLRGYFIDIAGRRGDVIWARRLYDHVLDMRTDVRTEPAGVFANHMREFEHIRDFTTSAVMASLIDFPFALLFIFAVYLLGGAVAFVPLILFVAVFVLCLLLQMPVKNLVRRSAKSSEEKQGILIETLNGLESVKGCGATRHFRSVYGRYAAESALYGQKSRFWSGLSVHVATFAQQISAVGIVLFGMYMVRDGDLSTGALIACVILAGRAIAPVAQVAGLINKYHYARSALKTLNRVMKMPEERPKNRRFLHRPSLHGLYAVDNLGFTYAGATVPALQNLRFSIQAGERVGIVGRIGSGKSTLIKLLMKFYQPETGVVRLDGTDLQQIDPVDLRRDISYIGQDTTLFRGTVRENIAMGHPGATDDDVLKAAQISGAHAFIRHHPLGYDAPVGEGGRGFSGGQKQAIAIARALVGNPHMLICDEPTNEMDNASENQLVKSLQGWLDDGKRGLIVVTHRFSLLEMVDRLILMDQGKILMDGPKEKVIAALNSGQLPVQSTPPNSAEGG
ncbi:MAG: type I secretion system permease/ATPase [Alphaproteobacteria bacterium]|nr:MAG: type I secretion system permease/ATPase [Alphaproteobacteria bacterium]